MSENKYKILFDVVPVPIIELDYGALSRLAQQLRTQTVTNVRKYLSENQSLIRETFANARITEANPVALKFFRARDKKDLLTRLNAIFSNGAAAVLTEQFVSLLEGQQEFSSELKYAASSGKLLDVCLKVTVLPGCEKSFSKVVLSFQDITPWKSVERQLRKKAQLDSLTQLYNHTTIIQRINEELIRAKRYGSSLTCMMIDLDNFKVINDKLGHQRGDYVLKQVAQMIRSGVRQVDLVGRYGGDEFLLILPETKVQDAKLTANRIHNIFASKLLKSRKVASFQISLSIGISGYPSAQNVSDAKDLIALADKAMYEAKKGGRNRTVIR